MADVAGNKNVTSVYGDPVGGTASTVGKQFRTDKYDRAALIDALDELRISQHADTTFMPKHQGKQIKRYRYFRILDERNQTNQGIDSTGTAYANGNLYGSSKDIATITSKLPTLTEAGGRVNRVGQTRLDVVGSIQNLGFFQEYSADSLDFDTDASLYSHYTREMMRAAVEIYEDMLTIDLLNGANTALYAGAATSDATITGEGNEISLISYDNLTRLNRMLDIQHAKRTGKILKGSQLKDTATVDNLRTLYVGYDLQPVIEDMVDNHGNPAFIPRRKYASQTNLLAGEIGSIAGFRVVITPRMPKWAGKGAAATAANKGYQATNSKYDVFPALVISPMAFTTIGFQSSSTGSQKYNFKHLPPGTITHDNPYGKIGIMSMEWWYGTMIYDPTHLGLIKTVAPM